MMSRRNFMTTSAAGMAGAALGIGIPRPVASVPLADDMKWLTALGTSLTDEYDYAPVVEGRLPTALQGQLFRNGPGLFERNGYRKQHLLDGDRMIQCFDFAGDSVRYRNRFVRTAKFIEEESAGELRYPTWTTRAPGGMFANMGPEIKTQAGVTTLIRNSTLLALDEGLPLYTLDPKTLETSGQFEFPSEAHIPGCKAHTKTDPSNGDWILIGTEYGRTLTIRHLILDRRGRIKSQGQFSTSRMTYVHDFFATEQHIVIVLHAIEFSPLGFLAGANSFTDALSWVPEQGNLVMVLDKAGGDPVAFEAPAAFMWHSVNAYAAGDEIIADFIGYANPDHFIGEDPVFKTLMQGEAGNAKYPGKLQRYRIDLKRGSLREEILDDGHQEFPTIDPRKLGSDSRYAFMNRSPVGDWRLDGVAIVDMQSGSRDEFRFGPKHFVSEPIFAPNGDHEGSGWLLAQVQSGITGDNFLAIFDTASVSEGPVAKVHLTHHVPLSFHGYWSAQN